MTFTSWLQPLIFGAGSMLRDRRLREGGRGNRRGIRPRLEALEDRCVPSTVTNLYDDGSVGSLRWAIGDTPAGGTVDFQQGLAGTITLASSELLIDKDLTITGPGQCVITVNANWASRVFEIANSTTVAISGLAISGGGGFNIDTGAGILNSGSLTVLDHQRQHALLGLRWRHYQPWDVGAD